MERIDPRALALIPRVIDEILADTEYAGRAQLESLIADRRIDYSVAIYDQPALDGSAVAEIRAVVESGSVPIALIDAGRIGYHYVAGELMFVDPSSS